MRPAEKDAGLLWDMLEAGREACEFTKDVDLEGFIADRKLCLAVERCLEIIGEAAGKVTDTFQHSNPQIPWRQIKGMRNILAHEYGNIDHEIVHATVIGQLPDLIRILKALLRSSGNA